MNTIVPSELDLIKRLIHLLQSHNDDFVNKEIEKTLKRTRWIFEFHKFLSKRVGFVFEFDETKLKYYYQIYDILYNEREGMEYNEIPKQIKKALYEIFYMDIMFASSITVKWQENLNYSFTDFILVQIKFDNNLVVFSEIDLEF